MALKSIDYENEIYKLDPQLYSVHRLPNRIQSLYCSRTIAIDIIAHQCFAMVLVGHQLRLLAQKHSTKIGIIGGGRVGCEIANVLIQNSWPPTRLFISTRQPEEDSRCDCPQIQRFNDNVKVAQECDIVILAMPPSQLNSVGIQIKHALSQRVVLLITVLAGVNAAKVSKVCTSRYTLKCMVNVAQLSTLHATYYNAVTWAADQLARKQYLIQYFNLM